MNFYSNVGGPKMIEKIPNLPNNVLGVTAKGTVTAKDYESAIIPAVEALFARHDKVRFLYHLGKDFSGFEAAAVWDDTKLGLKHLAGWERMALVSDVEWIRAAVKIFGLAIPGHVRVFHNRELSEATRWISE
jgi:SpoIIAA-like